MLGKFRLPSLSIKVQLILLGILANAISLSVGYEGLRQTERSNAAFQNIFETRVVAAGYLKNVETGYSVDIPGAAGKFSDGSIAGDQALKLLDGAKGKIDANWSKFVARQTSDVDKGLTQAVDALKSGVDSNLTPLEDLIKKGDKTGVRKFLDESWNSAANPFVEQLTQSYETLQGETRDDFADLQVEYNKGRNLQFYILGIGLIFSIAIGSIVLISIMRSLSRVRKQLHELAAGEGDLTLRLAAGNNEIGSIAREVNSLMDKLLILVRRVQEAGVQVTSSSTQLSSSSHALEATLGQQLASTNEVVSSAKQISATAQALVKTMGHVAYLSQEAAQSATHGQSGLKRMSSTMEKMEAASTTMAQRLAAINSKVLNITGVVTTINKVADQTNLLSLNAAIEAAKAGEFGQGFSVVAREIRRLADQTAVATLDIEQTVKEMQSSVSSGVMAMEKFAQEVQGAVQEVNGINEQMGHIIDQVQGLGPQFESVNEGMESQSIGARQISESMIQLREATSSTAQSQRDSARVVEALDQAARVLHQEVTLFRVEQARVVAPESQIVDVARP